MKKIIAIATALTVSVWMVGPGIAQGATVEDLTAQIADLQAQLTALQAQLAALTGAPAAACTFTRNLYPGVSGADVQCLQQYLNSTANKVATTGAGSPGNETQYYGPLTQAAVASWQAANGVVCGAYCGYFGPLSRAKYTALGVVPPPPAACTTDADCPAGQVCTAGACVTAPTVPGITTPGAEGSIIATIASTPASGAEVYIKTTNVGIAGADVKATGSDVLVKRFDVNFSKRPWLYFKNLTITDGTTSKTVAVTEAGTAEITVGSSYTVRVEGVNILIPKDTTKTLTIKADGVDALPGTETSTNVTVTIGQNAIRGVDGANIDQYAPTGDLATRTVTAKSGDTANIEVTANVGNPKSRSVIVQSTAEISDVVLAKINIKATNRDAILRTVLFEDRGASNTLKTVYLYDGDTLLSSTSSITTGSSTLTDIGLTIPKDATKTLTMKASVYKSQGNYGTTGAGASSASSTIILAADATSFSAEDATTFAAATVSGSDVVPGVAYFLIKAPMLALDSTSITRVGVSTSTFIDYVKAEAKIKVQLTASGGDIYVASTTTNDVTATTTTGASTTILEIISSNADTTSGQENWVVYSGDTKWFEFYGMLENDPTQPGIAYTTYMYLTEIGWETTDAAASAPIIQTWGLSDFKTSNVALDKVR